MKACITSNVSHHDDRRAWQCTYSDCNVDILSEDYTLELNDEKVDQLLNVIGEALKRSLVDREVLARANLRNEAVAKSSLAKDLRGSGN